MSQSPLISVLMPVYNAERYVAAATESILSQTLTDFELLIIDDGSTDSSLRIIMSYAAKDKRIRLTSRENLGISCSLNEMLHQAQGKLIARMDSDDIALPERFERQVAFLNDHPEVVCVGGAHEVIDERGRFLTCLTLPEHNDEIQRLALAGHGSICHPCAMIRKASLLEVNGYDETLFSAEDLDLWLKLGEVGALSNLKDPILKYRLHTKSWSGRNLHEQRYEARVICERAWQRRGIEGNFEATEQWRPGKDRSSRLHFTLKYGWWAFNSNQRWTALIYGFRSVAIQPFSLEAWKLLICPLIKISASA